MKDYYKTYAESIAKEYAEKKSSKIVALKKLDRKAETPAFTLSMILGIGGRTDFPDYILRGAGDDV